MTDEAHDGTTIIMAWNMTAPGVSDGKHAEVWVVPPTSCLRWLGAFFELALQTQVELMHLCQLMCRRWRQFHSHPRTRTLRLIDQINVERMFGRGWLSDGKADEQHGLSPATRLDSVIQSEDMIYPL